MARNVNGADYGTFTGRYADIAASPRGMLYLTYPIDPQRSKFLDEQFLEDTINLDYWTLTKDTNATNFAIVAGAGGTLRGTAGNTNGEGIGMYGPAIYKGDLNCGIEVTLKFDQITNGSFEIGFADTATDFKDPIVTDVDTPTAANGAGDFACIKRDTAQTLTTCALVGLGSTPYAVTKANLGTFAPSAATYFTARVQLIGDTIFGAIFNSSGLLSVSTSLVTRIEGGTLLSPYINVTRTATADVVCDVTRVRVWQDKA